MLLLCPRSEIITFINFINLRSEIIKFINFINVINLEQIRHTQHFIVVFNTLHPEDGRRRRKKHVGVVYKQCI
jgi:hypothetical protein